MYWNDGIWVASQCVGFVALALCVWALQIKDKPKMLIVNGIACSVICASLALLQNWVVLAILAVAAIRSFIYAYIEILRRRGKKIPTWLPYVIMVALMIATAVPVVFTWNLWVDWVLMGISLVVIYGTVTKEIHIFRVSLLIYGGFAIVNHVYFDNIIGMVTESVQILAILVFYAMFFFAKHKNKEVVNANGQQQQESPT